MHRAALVCSALILAGCLTPEKPTNGQVLDRPIVVLAQDLSAQQSALGRIDPDGTFSEVRDPTLGSDPFLVGDATRPFILVDDDNTLRSVDTDKLGLGPVVFQLPKGDGPGDAFPHDIAVDASGRYWVTLYGRGAVAVVDPADTGAPTLLDLSGLDPDHANPCPDGIRIVGERAYVSLEFLNADLSAARRPGALATIDTKTLAVDPKLIDLSGNNPFGRLIPEGDTGRIIVPTPGDVYGIDDGSGIDEVDLATGKARQVISETAMNGSVSAVAWAGEHEAYAIVMRSDTTSATSVISFDPSDGKLLGTLAKAESYVHSGLTLTADFVLVGDRSPESPAILVFDRKTGDPRDPFVPPNLPPRSLLALSAR